MKEGWKMVKLGDVCTIERGGSPRPIKDFLTDAPNGINWIKIGDAKNGSKYITETKEKIKPEGIKRSRMVYSGDFILSNSMSFGKPYILKIDGCIHDGWLVIRDDNNVFDKDYLYYSLINPQTQIAFAKEARGGVVNNLNCDRVRITEIPLPPLSEQTRIVSLLDDAFGKLERSREKALKLLDDAKEIFQAQLKKEMTPKEGWKVKKLGEVLKFINGRAYSKSELLSSGKYKVLRVGNFFTNDTWYYSDLELDDNKYCNKGDLLYAWSTSFGPKIWEGEKTIFHYHIWNVKFNPTEFNKYYLYYFLDWDKDTIKSSTTGTTMVHVSMSNMVKRTIGFPPLSEQSSIVSRLDVLSSQLKQIEEKTNKYLADLDELKQSLLKKAFEGKL